MSIQINAFTKIILMLLITKHIQINKNQTHKTVVTTHIKAFFFSAAVLYASALGMLLQGLVVLLY